MEKIGPLAYKLDLLATSRVHPVFYVSQLKPFTPDYTPVFGELPSVPDPSTLILERRMTKRGKVAIAQLKVQWGVGAHPATTWEDYEVLRQRFPMATIWQV